MNYIRPPQPNNDLWLSAAQKRAGRPAHAAKFRNDGFDQARIERAKAKRERKAAR